MFRPPASTREIERIHDLLASELEREPGVVVAYLHGSFLESMYRDIDVAVLLAGPVPPDARALREELRLTRVLTRRLDLGVEVDVRALNDAPLAFRFEVLRKGRRLVSKDEALRVEHETRTIAAFHDFQHHYFAYGREILGART